MFKNQARYFVRPIKCRRHPSPTWRKVWCKIRKTRARLSNAQRDSSRQTPVASVLPAVATTPSSLPIAKAPSSLPIAKAPSSLPIAKDPATLAQREVPGLVNPLRLVSSSVQWWAKTLGGWLKSASAALKSAEQSRKDYAAAMILSEKADPETVVMADVGGGLNSALGTAAENLGKSVVSAGEHAGKGLDILADQVDQGLSALAKKVGNFASAAINGFLVWFR